jgi:uncharacterized protein (DUF2141 family)
MRAMGHTTAAVRRARRTIPAALLVGGVAALGSGNTRPASVGATQLGTLVVTVSPFRNTKGQAIVALYSSKERWLKSERALRFERVPIADTSVIVTFTDLAPGLYAASAIHDQNGNGKLDMRYFPVPKPSEPAGVSNNKRRALGPPSWDDATFTLADSSQTIAIELRR